MQMRFKPYNHMQPGATGGPRGRTSPHSISHYRLIPGSLDVAAEPPDGIFIIDSDLSPSLPTSDSVLVCVHIELRRAGALECEL